MGITYNPLFKLLIDRGMKKTDLCEKVGLSLGTVAKFSKGETVDGKIYPGYVNTLIASQGTLWSM